MNRLLSLLLAPVVAFALSMAQDTGGDKAKEGLNKPQTTAGKKHEERKGDKKGTKSREHQGGGKKVEDAASKDAAKSKQ